MKDWPNDTSQVVRDRIFAKVAVVIIGLLLTLVAPIGMWLTIILTEFVEKNVIVSCVGFVFSCIVWILASILIKNAMKEWYDYVVRFAKEENAYYNRSTSASQLVSAFVSLDIIRDMWRIVIIWMIASLGFTIVFATSQINDLLKLLEKF